MPTRKFHGITDVEHGTASALSTDGDGTSIADIVAGAGAEGGEGSRIEFLDEEGNMVDIHGNQYAGVLYSRWVIKAKDLTAFAAIRGNWTAGTPTFFAADLDNGERVHTEKAVKNLEYIRPVNILGQKQGQAAAFEMAFRVPFDDLTFA